MAGIPLPAPPTIKLDQIRDPAVKVALQGLLVYLDSLRRRIEKDYS